MNVEWGSNLLFKNMNFQGFLNCIYDHKYISDRCSFGNETVEFRGDKKSVIFYDKIAEMFNDKLYTKKAADFLKKKLYVVRYEIKIPYVSSYDFTKDYMSTPADILQNWNIIVEEWEREALKIIYLNVITPEISEHLTRNFSEKEFKEYLIYKGMENMGIDNFRSIHAMKVPRAKRSESDAEYRAKYEKFKDMSGVTFQTVFLEAIRKKANYLKVPAPSLYNSIE